MVLRTDAGHEKKQKTASAFLLFTVLMYFQCVKCPSPSIGHGGLPKEKYKIV